jgi:ABC-type transport system involved in multi-copper enzyme maturation permease subunit
MSLSAAFKVIYAFFFTQERKARRMKIFLFLSLIPVIILLLAKIGEIGNPDGYIRAARIFSQMLLVIYIKLLIPILALLYGSIIINEEVDQKTLVFLTTSPIPKPAVLLGKYAAYATLTSIILGIGLFLSLVIVNVNHLGRLTHVNVFFNFLGVGVLALVAYMAFFSFLGALLKKSMIIGLFFVFGWEIVASLFPGMTQKLTFSYYIKSLLPYSADDGSFLSFLMVQVEPISKAGAVIVLLLSIVVFLTAGSYLFQKKEYIISDAV